MQALWVKKYFLSATKEERAQFIEVFKISLLDTYAETLAQWGDAEIITDFSYDEKKNKIVSVKQESTYYKQCISNNL